MEPEVDKCSGKLCRRSEIKILSNVDVKKLQKEIDSMSCELRKIEDAIQFTNWTVDLM